MKLSEKYTSGYEQIESVDFNGDKIDIKLLTESEAKLILERVEDGKESEASVVIGLCVFEDGKSLDELGLTENLLNSMPKKLVEELALVNKNRDRFFERIKETGGIFTNPDRQDLKSLPVPAYDLFPLDQYKWRGIPTISVEATRGCPGQCSFCVVPKLYQGGIEACSPEYFVNML